MLTENFNNGLRQAATVPHEDAAQFEEAIVFKHINGTSRSGMFAPCCRGPQAEFDGEGFHEVFIDGEEEIKPSDINRLTLVRSSGALEPMKIGNGHDNASAMIGKDLKEFGPPAREGVRWDVLRPVIMCILVAVVSIASLFFENGDPHVESFLRYGTIPIIAAIIGYGTNVVALQMMFYPLQFIGCFPQLKIGLGLDLFLCGWQGVIPMKAREMATTSVDLMTQKLIQVDEIFNRLDPDRVARLMGEIMPQVVSDVLTEAGRKHCPKLWEHLPPRAKRQLEQQVMAESGPMMANFMKDLQRDITDDFDLKACVVERLVEQPQIMNELFLLCGAEEFEFIKNSGFYLGFLFGLVQMMVWRFVKNWWILPLCGVFVGWATNVVALKVIFYPVDPRPVLGGLITVQGLFLKRQGPVSALYGKATAEKILSADVLMQSLVTGPKANNMFALVDKHVAANMEDQAAKYKPFFLMSLGAETWVDFRGGVQAEFRKRLPALLDKIVPYAQETMELEETLRTRLERLNPAEFERLLHAVFEQDEIKLILVGAILGAIVGFLQAVVQTPEQLGLDY